MTMHLHWHKVVMLLPYIHYSTYGNDKPLTDLPNIVSVAVKLMHYQVVLQGPLVFQTFSDDQTV